MSINDIPAGSNLPDEINGIVVAEVYPRTYAQSLDLRAGDIITSVDNKTIVTLSDLYLAMAETSAPVYTVFRKGEVLELGAGRGQ